LQGKGENKMSEMFNTGVWANCEELKNLKLMVRINKKYNPGRHAAFLMAIYVEGELHYTRDPERAAHLLAMKHGLPKLLKPVGQTTGGTNIVECWQYTLSRKGEFMINAEAWEKYKGGDQQQKNSSEIPFAVNTFDDIKK